MIEPQWGPAAPDMHTALEHVIHAQEMRGVVLDNVGQDLRVLRRLLARHQRANGEHTQRVMQRQSAVGGVLATSEGEAVGSTLTL